MSSYPRRSLVAMAALLSGCALSVRPGVPDAGASGRDAGRDAASPADSNTTPDAIDAADAQPDGTSIGDGATPSYGCGAGLWCWLHPQPQGHPLNAVWLHSATEGWAVGDLGTTVRLRGGTWSSVPSPIDGRLVGVWGSGPTDVWAWGEESASDAPRGVLHWDGTQWTLTTPGRRRFYTTVAGTAANDVWVLNRDGSGADVLHWDGVRWSALPALPRSRSATGLCVRGPNDVFATTAGLGLTSTARWDGMAWTEHVDAMLSFGAISGVSCRAGSEVFARSSGISSDRVLLRWAGTAWGETALTPIDPAVVTMTRDNEFFVSHGGRQTRWNGTSWEAATVVPALRDFDLLRDRSAGWLLSADRGELVRWDATRWRADELPPRPTITVLGGAPGSMASVGFGAGHVARPRSDADAWVVAPLAHNATLRAAWGSRAGDVWAVGDNGAVVRELDGSAETVVSNTAENLVAVGGSGARDVWALARTGAIVRWDGARWSAHPTARPATLDGQPVNDFRALALRVMGPDDALVLGIAGASNGDAGASARAVLAQWNGAAWTARWLGAQSVIADDAVIIGANDVWIAGASGVWRWSGGAWSREMEALGGAHRIVADGAGSVFAYAYVRDQPANVIGRWDARTRAVTVATAPRVGTSLSPPAMWASSESGPANVWIAGPDGFLLRYAFAP